LALAINQGADAVSFKMLQKTAWPLDQSERMAREAVDGESEMSEREETRDRLRQMLQLGATHSATATARTNAPVPHAGPRVGQRRPVRDLVGVGGQA
jgi:ribosome assembly protein YihI (activator of Der GTPase)